MKALHLRELIRVFCLMAPLAAASCGTVDSGTTGGSTSPSGGGTSTSGDPTTSGTPTGMGSASGGGNTQPTPEQVYGASIKRVVIEVDYAAGFAPYTGNIVLFGDTWGLFQSNAERLFLGADKTLEIPSELAQMEELSGITGAEWQGQAILDVATQHRDQLSMGDTATYYFVWLPGYYHDGEKLRTDVLGVSLGWTGVVAMFKDVIAGTGVAPGDNIERYVEQATLVHEFGHAIGLVNNGLGLTADHQDEAHGAHCSNQDCIMFYAIEGTAGAVEFVGKAVKGESSLLFGGECLADIDAAIQKGLGK
jgi:hypothetical protein